MLQQTSIFVNRVGEEVKFDDGKNDRSINNKTLWGARLIIVLPPDNKNIVHAESNFT